jgi:Tfp pilus assembly protein PilF
MTNKHLERALHLIHMRPDLAAKELRLAIAQEPDAGYMHGLLASCLLDAGEKDPAFNEARQCIKLSPNSPIGFHTLAHCHFQTGEMLEAEVAIEEALRLDPHEPSYWGLLANIEIQNNNLEKALKAAENGLELDPAHAHCHNLRALILTKQGKSEQAKHSMDTAMAANPEHALTHAYRGWTLLEQHQHEQSREHFREALRLDPSLEWARAGMIKALEMRHWACQLHRRLANKWAGLAVVLWFCFNFQLKSWHLAGPEWQAIALTLLSFASWTSWAAFAFFTFLPYTLINEPILRFLLQFDPDGQYVLTKEEKQFNKHLVAFIVIGIGLTVVGICLSTWWPLAVVVTLYVATLPLSYPAKARRNWKVWAAHLLGAGVAALFILSLSTSQGITGVARTVVAINCFKWFAAPALGKVVFGAPLLKMLSSVPVIKGLAGALGLGALSQGLREQEKQKARAKMLQEAKSSTSK